MKKALKVICFILVQAILVSVLNCGLVDSYTNSGYKTTGYIAPDLNYPVEKTDVVRSNFPCLQDFKH